MDTPNTTARELTVGPNRPASGNVGGMGSSDRGRADAVLASQSAQCGGTVRWLARQEVDQWRIDAVRELVVREMSGPFEFVVLDFGKQVTQPGH